MSHEETLGSELSIERTVTTDLTWRSLIRVCAGRTGHLLDLSCCGSFIRIYFSTCIIPKSFLLKLLKDNKKFISFSTFLIISLLFNTISQKSSKGKENTTIQIMFLFYYCLPKS